jgi:putative transposase
MHQARIRTCTRNPVLRLLYVGVALLLRNVWVWLHWQVLARRQRGGRRIDQEQLRFRQMRVWLQHWAEALVGIDDEIATEHRMYE